MGIMGRAKSKDELALVFDIGSSSVGGALFFIQESGIPKIIMSVREPMILEHNLDTSMFLNLAQKALQIVADKIFKAGLGRPERIFCVLSSPFYVSQTRMIKYEKNTPFIFTEKFADSLVQKEIAVFESEYAASYNNPENKVRPIELKNIQTLLNGYDTAEPLNQKAENLKMTLFVSLSSEQVLQDIENIIRKFFQFKEIKFSSFIMASFTVVRDMYSHQENFLLVDIGGEVTDISMVKKNILRESVSFPLGRNFLVRGVGTALNCSLSDAQSFISLYKDGHADEATKIKLDPIISSLRIEWMKKFQESLANISNDISIPSTIYIALNKDLADFFAETIKSEQFNQYTLAESKFEVIFLGAEVFRDIAFFEGNVDRDAFLIMDSIYINRFLTKI